jgi:hypothetical protein
MGSVIDGDFFLVWSCSGLSWMMGMRLWGQSKGLIKEDDDIMVMI